MNKLKRKAFVLILLFSLAVAGVFKTNYAVSHLYSFYNSATVDTIRIDSVSLISADPAYGVIAVVGYGPLQSSGVDYKVDMTDAIDVNSFSVGHAHQLKGKDFSIFLNPDFEIGRLQVNTLEEVKASNFSSLLVGIALILPFVLTLLYWYLSKSKFGAAMALFFFSSALVGQDDTLRVPLPIFSSKNCRIYHHLYTSDEKVVLKFSDTLEARNNTPEVLIASILSEKNKGWTDYNTFGESEYKAANFYSRNSSSDKLAINLYLRSKLVIGCVDNPVAYVKFAVENENSKLSIGVYKCIWDEGRWKLDRSQGNSSDFSLAYALFDQDIFHRLLLKEDLSSQEKNLLNQVSTIDSFSIDAFAAKVLSWFQPELQQPTLIKAFTKDPGWN